MVNHLSRHNWLILEHTVAAYTSEDFVDTYFESIFEMRLVFLAGFSSSARSRFWPGISSPRLRNSSVPE